MRMLRRAPPPPPARPVRPQKNGRVVSPTSFGRQLVGGVGQFIYDTRAELRKVVWPTREQTLNLTALVIAVSLAVAAFIGIVDVVLQKLVQLLIGG
jgi:preprotein translocase subunit SecE